MNVQSDKTVPPFQDQHGRVYSSIKEAAEKWNIPAGNICNVLKRKRRSAGGLVFTYLHELSEVAEADREHEADKEKRKQETHERNLARTKSWHEAHPEYMSGYMKQYRKDHEEELRTKDRKSWLKVNYGITPEQYDDMLAAQGNRCAICRRESPGSKGRRFFYVDHDHKTGKIRGLLCHSCNTALGGFQDSPDLLQAAIAYLEAASRSAYFRALSTSVISPPEPNIGTNSSLPVLDPEEEFPGPEANPWSL